MYKCRELIKNLSIQRKIVILFTLFLLAVASLMTGTHAWMSTGQRALNSGQNTVEKKAVYLQKLERDLEGNETNVTIKGAKFYLYQLGKSKDTQIGSTYTTDKEGKIQVELAVGEYYFEEFDPSSGFTFDTDQKGEPIKRYPFKVTATSTSEQAIVVAYNKRQIGNLEVLKTVKNEDSSPLTAKQKEKEFLFQVMFNDKGSYSYRIDGGEKKILKSGEKLSLKHSQKAVFDQVPIGVHYQVIEEPTIDYISSADNSSGNIQESVSSVLFVNTYNPQTGPLEISKEVINGDKSPLTTEQKNQPFEFEVSFSDPTTAFNFSTTTGRKGALKSGDLFTLVHGEILTFSALPQGLSYVVKENPTSHYTSSPSQYAGTVLTKEAVRLPFVNQYQMLTGGTGSLVFDKQVIATQINPAQEFAFTLTFSDNGTYEYQKNEGEKQSFRSGDTLLIKHGETIRFSALPAGVAYTLVEQPLEGYHPQLEEMQGTILSDHETHVTFHNYIQEKAQLMIEKIGVGEGFDLEKDFLFHVWINGKQMSDPIRLKAGETSLPIPLNLGDTWTVMEENGFDDDYSQTELIHGTGVASIPNETVKVSQTNTYVAKPMVDLSGQKTWSIPENVEVALPDKIKVQLKNKDTVVATQEVTGPEWKYHFHVPKLDAQGEVIIYTVEEEPVENFHPLYEKGTLNITNVYQIPVLSRALPVEKRVVGDTPKEVETFEFRLNPSQQMIQIAGEGEATFDPISFTHAGTYTYTITERKKGTLGYTYDSSVYTWTIVVTEKENQLVIASEEIKKDGILYTERTLLFENHFDASKIIHEKITIDGLKTWNYGNQSKESRPQTITVLLRGNGEVVYQREISASDGWAYSFSVNSHDEEGKEIVYSIDEVPVAGYEKSVNGYNLTNTYIGTEVPGKGELPITKPPTESGSSGSYPKTGEKVRGYLLAAGIGALVILAGLTIIYRNKKNGKR